jgi:diguanylate cyclase
MDELDLFAEDVEAAEAASLTQRAFVDTQQNLGKMLDWMPIGLLIHTEQGIVLANRQACSFLQGGMAKLRGQHLLDYTAIGDVDSVAHALRMTITDPDSTSDVDCAIERPDSSSRLMKLTTGSLP